MNNHETITRQFLLTPAAGKRLIAKAFLHIPAIIEALEKGTVVIIAGTTNGYIAEEILGRIDQLSGFSKQRFFRGVTLPPVYAVSETGRLSDESRFPGDVVVAGGKWMKGKTVFDVAGKLKKGDVVIKGANALNVENRRAAIYIGGPEGGTILAVLQAVVGRRVELYLPVGLEKRVPGDLDKIALMLNSPNASGPRMLPVCGKVITELDAIRILTGAQAELIAAGGVCGAEGSCWLAVSGAEEQVDGAEGLIKSVSGEPGFKL